MAITAQDLMNQLQSLAGTETSSDFFDRLNSIPRLQNFAPLSNHWDFRYGAAGREAPHNAYMLGLVLIDWDNSFRARNTKIKTSDLQIPFQYIRAIPDWKKAANYGDAGGEIMGRYEQIPMYSNSVNQEFELTIIYQAEALNNYGANAWWTMENIEKYVKRLQ